MTSEQEFEALEELLDGSDFGAGIEDPTSDPGITTSSVVTDMDKALKSNMKIGKLGKSFQESMSDILPNRLSDNLNLINDNVDTIMGDVDTRLTQLRKDASSTLGRVVEVAPEPLVDPLTKLKNWLYESESSSINTGPSEDEIIQSKVNSTMDSTKETGTNTSELTQQLLTKQNTELLANIAANSKLSLSLKYDVDSKYYKKDLELQMKQTLTLVSMHQLMQRDSEIHAKQLEAIVKNTATPDTVKQDLHDSNTRQSLIDTGISAFKESDVYASASKNITNLVAEKIDASVEGLGLVDSMAEMSALNKELGITPVDMLLDSLVKGGMDKVTKHTSENILKQLLSNSKGQEALSDLDKTLVDPSRVINKLYMESLNENSSGLKTSLLETLDESFSKKLKKSSYTIKETNTLQSASSFDEKTKETQNVVIPNLLSKILAEVTTIRKGNNLVSRDDNVSYDFKTGTFKSDVKIENELIKDMEVKGDSLFRSVNNDSIFNALTNNRTLNDLQKESLSIALINYLSDGKSASPYYMKEDGLLGYIDNPSLANSVKIGLNVLNKPTTTEEFNKVSELTDTLQNIQTSSTSNYKDITEKINKTTNVNALNSIGLTTTGDNTEVSSENITNLNKKYAALAARKTFRKEGFFTGGYTGDVDVNIETGPTHGREYTINNEKLKTLLKSVSNNDTASILKSVENIASEVEKKSKIYNNILPSNGIVTDVKDKAIDTYSSVYKYSKENIDSSKISEITDSVSNITDNLLVNLNKVNDTLTSKTDSVIKISNINFTKGLSNIARTFEQMLKVTDVNVFDVVDEIDKTSKAALNTVSNLDNKTISENVDKLSKDTKTYINETIIKSIKIKDAFTDTNDNMTKVKSVYENIDTNMVTDSVNKVTNKIQNTLSNSGITSSVTEMLSSVSDSDINVSTKTISKLIESKGLDTVVKNILSTKPMPTTNGQANKIYTEVINTIDPTGEYFNDIDNMDTFISDMTLLHKESISDIQNDAISSMGSMGETITGGSIGNKAFDMLPTSIQNTISNKYTEFAGGIVSRAKKGVVNAAKASLPEFRKVGANVASEFRDENGDFDMPGLLGLSKAVGKGYFGGMKATGAGIRELYPELFGIMKDTVKFGGSEAINLATGGAFKPGKKKTPPPINKELYAKWSSGDLTGMQVLDQLETDEEKQEWTNWLETSAKKGIPIMDILNSTGKMYLSGMVNLSKIIKPTYKTAGKFGMKAAKATVKQTFKGFNQGGYTGDIGINEIAGPIHGREYAINNRVLRNLIDNVNSNNVENIMEIVNKITKDVYNTSKKVYNKNIDLAKVNTNKLITTSTNKFNSTIDNINSTKSTNDIKEYVNNSELMNKTMLMQQTIAEKTRNVSERLYIAIERLTQALGLNTNATLAPKPELAIIPSISKLDNTIQDMTLDSTKDKFRFFDRDKDGDRDGNVLDRMAKYYQKDDEDEGTKTVRMQAANTVCWGGTTCLTKMVAAMSAGIGLYLGFEHGGMKETLGGFFTNVTNAWNKGVELFTKISDTLISTKNKLGALPTYIGLIIKELNPIKDQAAMDQAWIDYDYEAKGKVSPHQIREKTKELSTELVTKREIITERFKKEYVDKQLLQYDKDNHVGHDLPLRPEQEQMRTKARAEFENKTRSQYDLEINTQLDTQAKIDNELEYHKSNTVQGKHINVMRQELMEEIKRNFINQGSKEYDINIQSLKDNPGVSEVDKEEAIKILTADKHKIMNELTNEWDTKVQYDPELVAKVDKQMESVINGEIEFDAKKQGLSFLEWVFVAILIILGALLFNFFTGRIGSKLLGAAISELNRKRITKSDLRAADKYGEDKKKKAAKKIQKDRNKKAKELRKERQKRPARESRTSKKRPNFTNTQSKPRGTTGSNFGGNGKKSTTFNKIKPKIPVNPHEANLSGDNKKLLGQIRSKLDVLKRKVIAHYGPKKASKLLAKTLARLIPGAGTWLLAIDLGMIGSKYLFTGLSLMSVVSLHYFDIDFFDEEDVQANKLNDPTIDMSESNRQRINNFTNSTENNMTNTVSNNLSYSGQQFPVNNFIPRHTEKETYVSSTLMDYLSNRPKPTVMASGKMFTAEGGVDKLILEDGAKVNNMLPYFKQHLFAMANEYHAITGKGIPINSGYRSKADQIAMRNKYGPAGAALPGNSTHEHGFAFDTNIEVANELDKLGLMRKYGFTRPVGGEGWHVEPSSLQGHLSMAKKDHRFADALIKSSAGTGGGGWAINPKAEKNTRNKEYQRSLMDGTSTTITNEHISTIDRYSNNAHELMSSTKKYVDETINNVSNMDMSIPNSFFNTANNETNTKVVKERPPTTNTLVSLSKKDAKQNEHIIEATKNVNVTLNSHMDKSLVIQRESRDYLAKIALSNADIVKAINNLNPNAITPSKQKEKIANRPLPTQGSYLNVSKTDF